MALSNAHKRRMLDRYAGEKYQPKKVQPQQNDNPAFNDTSSEIIDDLIDDADALVDDADVAVVDTDKVVTAGFMGLPNLAWIAIGGVALYYAYSKGMFKKLMK